MQHTLVTGAAGFIGHAVCLELLKRGDKIIGIDNHNNYYDPKIKDARLQRLKKYSSYNHYKLDIIERNKLDEIFKTNHINKIQIII